MPAGDQRAELKRILCVGIPVRDLIFRLREVPERGAKVSAEHFDELAGGNALNAAVGVARLGGEAAFSGPMGDVGETAARYILDQLSVEGIDTSGVVYMPGLVTAISNIMIDPSGERTAVTYRHPDLRRVKLPDPDRLLAGCAAVLTENRCAEFVTDLCAEARRRNIPVVVDADQVMSLREGLLNASSHLIFSAEALFGTAGTRDIEEALRKVAAMTTSFVGVTLGAQGMTWLGLAGRIHRMPTFPVHTIDTLGAGDIFHGGFALAIAEGSGIEHAMRFASAAAALKCTRFGGAFAAPARAEVEQLLQRHDSTAPAPAR